MEDLTGVGKIVTTLIEKISDATGVVYEPRRIKRKAIAEAEAKVEVDKILAQGEIDNKPLIERAANRMLQKAVSQQENIEAVIEGAIPQLEDQSKPENIDDDWLNLFVDCAEKVSDEGVRKQWSKVLAGEANKTGSFKPRTLSLLANMSAGDAVLLSKLACGTFSINGHEFYAVIPSKVSDFSDTIGLDYGSLAHLHDIGIISFKTGGSFMLRQSLKPFELLLHMDDRVVIKAKPRGIGWFRNNFDFEMGNVKLTESGEQLLRLVENVERSTLLDFLCSNRNPYNWKLMISRLD
jgi:hypothetical protein